MSTIGSRWNADRCKLERATSARSLFDPLADDRLEILLTGVLLATAVAVIVFGAPPLPATVGAVGTFLSTSLALVITYASRQGVARAG